MTDVSMIGCGRMGSAMVEALRDAGTEVTDWNRTRDALEGVAPRPLLDRPGGTAKHLGEDPGLPSALNLPGVEEGRGDHDITCVAELQVNRPGSSPAE